MAAISSNNIFNKNSKIILDSKYGRSICLEELNLFLFGVKEVPKTSCLFSLKDKNIIFLKDKTYYLPLLQFSNYCDAIGSLENYNREYLLINYKNITEENLDLLQSKIRDFLEDFVKFLKNRNSINSNYILEYIGETYTKGRFECYNQLANIYTISFETPYRRIILSFGEEDLDHKFYINLEDYNLKNVYKIIQKDLLLNNPDEFVKQHLTKLVGNKYFGELLFSSHNQKNEYIINVNQLDTIIQYKSDKLKSEYLEQYMYLYRKSNLYDDNGGDIMLNFEGFQKYLLNCESKYLESFEVRESINHLYYNITNELINCYKELYNSKC